MPGRTIVNEKGEVVREEPPRLMFAPIVVNTYPGYYPYYPPPVYYPYYPQPAYYSSLVVYRASYYRPVRTVYVGGERHYRGHGGHSRRHR